MVYCRSLAVDDTVRERAEKIPRKVQNCPMIRETVPANLCVNITANLSTFPPHLRHHSFPGENEGSRKIRGKRFHENTQVIFAPTPKNYRPENGSKSASLVLHEGMRGVIRFALTVSTNVVLFAANFLCNRARAFGSIAE